MTEPSQITRKLENQAQHLTYYPHWLDNLADDLILQGAVSNGELRGMSAARPGPIQYIAFSYGLRQLPDSMREWVARDLAGPGAVRRFMVRAAIPPLVVLAPFWLLPVEQNSLYVHAEMTVPIYLWTLLMSLALNKVWRRYRLAVHGLDSGLADATRREKNAKIDEDYIRRYGPRPEEAKWQANSNPFF
jgi:hypothetical protein